MVRIRIKCAKCGHSNTMPHAEMAFRINDDRRPLCCKCCKEKRWESKVCKSCSDRVTCIGAWLDKMKECLKKTGGV